MTVYMRDRAELGNRVALALVSENGSKRPGTKERVVAQKAHHAARRATRNTR